MKEKKELCIINGIIHDAVNKEPYSANILINDGKIAQIGRNLNNSGIDVLDAQGMDIYPGFIDAHTHIGLFGFSDPNTKDDVEEYKRCTPENRAIDAINPVSIDFEKALRGGVTSICDSPGSVNCIGGTATAIKTYGKCIDKMVIKDPVAMKIAFGENPKAKLKDHLSTRMSSVASIRDYLYRASEYLEKKENAAGDIYKMPSYNAGLEALIPVLKGELPVKAHAHRAADIFTAIRIAKEFNLKMTLEHVSEAIEIVDELAEAGYPICAGPYSNTLMKAETAKADSSTAVALIKAGCHVSVMTDFPILGEDNLPLCAGMLIRDGLGEFEALKTITINAAEHIGIADRVGSLEIGKDADIVISKGNPMLMGTIMTVLIDGKVCHRNRNF